MEDGRQHVSVPRPKLQRYLICFDGPTQSPASGEAQAEMVIRLGALRLQLNEPRESHDGAFLKPFTQLKEGVAVQ